MTLEQIIRELNHLGRPLGRPLNPEERALKTELEGEWLERFMQDDSGLPSRIMPEPGEAMRAKCEEIAREEEEADNLFAARRIKDAIAALKAR